MGVPFEALIPYGIIIGFFGVTGIGLQTIKYIQNDFKQPRRGIDAWDRQSRLNPFPCDDVMERDLRLTGSLRGQTDNPVAPPGFELNNPWRVERRFY